MSNEAINSEESWFLISLQKENESLTVYSELTEFAQILSELVQKILQDCTLQYQLLIGLVEKVDYSLWMNYIY